MSDLKTGRRTAPEELGAIGVKHTAVDKDGAWDAGANLKRLGDKPTKEALRAMHAWVDPSKDPETKDAYKLPHHNVSADGTVGAANMKGVASAMGRLNGGGLSVPDADRKGVHAHLAAHYKDAGMKDPDLKAAGEIGPEDYFGGKVDGGSIAEFVPSTVDLKAGTIDCVWYGGQWVSRRDPDTGDPCMLWLDMAGARLDRLNAGAPVFDTHFTGDDFKSAMAGKTGTKAQVGVVRKAQAQGTKGTATLQFDLGDPDAAQLFRKVSAGIVQNLSFGAWIYDREKLSAGNPLPEGAPQYSNPNEMGMFAATDWEPFEISPCPVPADFSTAFLSASGGTIGSATSASKSVEEHNMEEQQLAAARDEAVKAERQRVSDIRAMAAPFKALDETFVAKLIGDGISADEARKSIMTQLAVKGEQDAKGEDFRITGEAVITREAGETRLAQMQSALLLRHDPKFGMAKRLNSSGEPTGEYLDGRGPDYQRRLEEQGRNYRGFSLLEMARESLQLRGINPRGMSKMELAQRALSEGRIQSESFSGGAESTTDFPSILANVANKTLRQAYEAWPRSFQPLAKQVTAADFKPINRVQLSDASALQKLNQKGEYHRANLTDSNQNYSLATYGEIVAITRKVIINDDLQAFTRVPAILGVAAARLESDTVWAVITGNQVMQVDNVAMFNSAHNNVLTGSSSSIITNALGALAAARKQLRLQSGPQGTPLNLVPRFLCGPAALETYLLQAVYPIDIASSDLTKVVPSWVRSMIPVIEPRLDAASGTAWYAVADPAQIDGLEYCYLEGQEGVYIETRQGFDVDGVEIKARLDFAAAAIDYRGWQQNAGA